MNENELIIWINEKTNTVSIKFENGFFAKLKLCLNILFEQKIDFVGKINWITNQEHKRFGRQRKMNKLSEQDVEVLNRLAKKHCKLENWIEVRKEFYLISDCCVESVVVLARLAETAKWEKEIDELYKDNPYPTDVFTGKTEEGKIGQFGKQVWNNCLDTLLIRLGGEEKDGKVMKAVANGYIDWKNSKECSNPKKQEGGRKEK